ncbi:MULTISPECIES: hypothetical protein [unclassified Sphingomonas]|nr:MULTISPECIES: hypothetical protein [unclassified Sphingomonas]
MPMNGSTARKLTQISYDVDLRRDISGADELVRPCVAERPVFAPYPPPAHAGNKKSPLTLGVSEPFYSGGRGKD